MSKQQYQNALDLLSGLALIGIAFGKEVQCAIPPSTGLYPIQGVLIFFWATMVGIGFMMFVVSAS